MLRWVHLAFATHTIGARSITLLPNKATLHARTRGVILSVLKQMELTCNRLNPCRTVHSVKANKIGGLAHAHCHGHGHRHLALALALRLRHLLERGLVPDQDTVMKDLVELSVVLSHQDRLRAPRCSHKAANDRCSSSRSAEASKEGGATTIASEESILGTDCSASLTSSAVKAGNRNEHDYSQLPIHSLLGSPLCDIVEAATSLTDHTTEMNTLLGDSNQRMNTDRLDLRISEQENMMIGWQCN